MGDRVNILRRAVVPKQMEAGKAGMMRSDPHHEHYPSDRIAQAVRSEVDATHPREVLFPNRYGRSSLAESNANAMTEHSTQASEAHMDHEPEQSQQSQQEEKGDDELEHSTLYNPVEASTVASPSPSSVWSAISTPVHRTLPPTAHANALRFVADTTEYVKMPIFMRFPPPRLYREFRVFGPRGSQYLWDDTITEAVRKAEECEQAIFDTCEPRVLLARFLDVPHAPNRSVLQWYWSRKLYFDPNTPRPLVPEDVLLWWEQMGFVGHVDSWPEQLERILQNERDGRSFQDRSLSFSSSRHREHD
jgi:hypothetical protein